MLSEAAMTACGPTVVTSCAHSTVTRSRLVIAFGRRFSPTVSGSQGGLADGPATDSQVNINNAERSADLRQPACCCIGWLNVRSLSNKTTTVHETMVDKSLDVFVATETWHHSSAHVSLRLATPADYQPPRPTQPFILSG